jgi:hypothetical protein
LAEFWTTFEPTEPKEVILRYRSAPWDDIIDDYITDQDNQSVLSDVTSSDQESAEEQEQDSLTINLIGRPSPPTHYVSVSVPVIAQDTNLPDPVAKGILAEGVHLPPPQHPTPSFVSTPRSHLMDQVIQDLQHSGILRPYPDIRYAYHMFLVAKSSGAARPVLDLSTWTPLYRPPPIRLYSAADVLSTISPNSTMVKMDLKSGFFQLAIHPQYWRYYGVYYNRQRFTWTRLPMGHPLAPSMMQRVATAVARSVTHTFQITMVAYLDDWLFFSDNDIPVHQLLLHLQELGFTINLQKSILSPTTALVYLGLNIDTIRLIHHSNTILPSSLDGRHLHRTKRNKTRSTTHHGIHSMAHLCHGLASVPRYSHSIP